MVSASFYSATTHFGLTLLGLPFTSGSKECGQRSLRIISLGPFGYGGVDGAFEIAEGDSRTALKQILDRWRRRRHAFLALHLGHLLEHSAQPRQLLVVDHRPFESEDDSTVYRSIHRERTPHFAPGNGHFRVTLSDMVNSVSYGGAVFLTAFAGFIKRRRKNPGASEAPERHRAVLILRSSRWSRFRLHIHLRAT